MFFCPLRGTQFEWRLEKPRSHSTPASPRGRLGGVGVRGRVGGFSPSGESIKAWLNVIRKCAAVSDLRRRLWDEGRRPGLGPRTTRPSPAGSHTSAPATLTPPFPGVRLVSFLCAPGVRASVAKPLDLGTLQATIGWQSAGPAGHPPSSRTPLACRGRGKVLPNVPRPCSARLPGAI